jgi:uncharacterized protein (DUF1499 family)
MVTVRRQRDAEIQGGNVILLKRALIGLIRSHEQTGEKATSPELKTRYYKLSKDKLWDEVISVLKNKPGYKVLHEVKSVGEIVLEKRTMTGRVQDVTLTVFSINPIKSAIDIYSASRGSLGDLGSNYRTILDIFNRIDQRLSQYKITN